MHSVQNIKLGLQFGGEGCDVLCYGAGGKNYFKVLEIFETFGVQRNISL